MPPLDMFIFGIALAVAVVPEALPAVVTISLAIGVRRMVRRQVLVRRLPVVETLGSTSVICSDKTGTLTKNEMTVRRLFVAGRAIAVSGVGYDPTGEFLDGDRAVTPSGPLLELLRTGILASDAPTLTHSGKAFEAEPDAAIDQSFDHLAPHDIEDDSGTASSGGTSRRRQVRRSEPATTRRGDPH